MDKLFLSINEKLRQEYDQTSQAWKNSPFAWLKSQPSRRVGAIAERLVEMWLKEKGFDVKPSQNSDFDRYVGDTKLEIKFSTLWEGGFYKFQQLRNQAYDKVFCLGLSPMEVHGWIVPKFEALKHAEGQHTGKSAIDTRWLTIYPSKVEDWLHPYGGDLARLEYLLSGLLG